jgi:hypothetical protein
MKPGLKVVERVRAMVPSHALEQRINLSIKVH